MATEASTQRSYLRSMLLVIGVSIGAGLLITSAYEVSHERILRNEQARRIANLTSVIDRSPDGESVPQEIDTSSLPASEHVTQIFAMLHGARPIAWVYSAVAPAGYNGPIELLIGLTPSGDIIRARVMLHRETPGLGDAIEAEKSDWLQQFENRNLENPANWALAVDGGPFDALTGATITPRAVVAALEAVLRYHATHADALRIALDEVLQASAAEEPLAADQPPAANPL